MNCVLRSLMVALSLCGVPNPRRCCADWGGGTLYAAQSPGVWLDVPFFKQEKNGCGAASIAMVMQYWQKTAAASGGLPAPVLRDSSTDPETIQRNLYSPKDRGIRASDMRRYFEDHGFRTFVFRGGWDDLKAHLEKGRPLIVALKPLPSETALHYVVVVGLDWRENVVLVNDAAQRKLLKQDRAVFEKEWSAVDRWTLLAVPRPAE